MVLGLNPASCISETRFRKARLLTADSETSPIRGLSHARWLFQLLRVCGLIGFRLRVETAANHASDCWRKVIVQDSALICWKRYSLFAPSAVMIARAFFWRSLLDSAPSPMTGQMRTALCLRSNCPGTSIQNLTRQ